MTAGSPSRSSRPADPALTAVREEDAFDVQVVHRWLVDRLPGEDGLVEPPEVLQFRGGSSNLTYLLRYPARDLVLRRPPRGTKAASAHDMKREYDVQSRLRPHFAAVPTVLAFCDDPAVLGDQFYVMERVNGLIVRSELPADLGLDETGTRELGFRIFDVLADLHSVDVDAAGLRDLWRGEGYVGRQVSGWSRRYRAARTDDVPDAEAVMGWLDAHQPQDVAARMIHGDWRFDNLVLDPADLSVEAALDWEMATVGDPLMDLGSALAYWVEAGDDDGFEAFRKQPSNAPGMPTRREIAERYTSRMGFRIDDWSFYEVFGVFRLAVIIQQIWFRFRAGQTTNPAFAHFGTATNYLVARATRLAGIQA